MVDEKSMFLYLSGERYDYTIINIIYFIYYISFAPSTTFMLQIVVPPATAPRFSYEPEGAPFRLLPARLQVLLVSL